MTRTCPYHGIPQPCPTCAANNMGAFARGPAAAAPAPAYVPPHRRPIHFHQTRRDTCSIACCCMVGANLNCPRSFTMGEVEDYMELKGVYRFGQMALFDTLDRPLEWLGLRCRLHQQVGPRGFAAMLRGGSMIIMEAQRHVIVIFDVNVDGTLIIGDPAMRDVEMSVPVNDYRLRGTGRIWEVRK